MLLLVRGKCHHPKGAASRSSVSLLHEQLPGHRQDKADLVPLAWAVTDTHLSVSTIPPLSVHFYAGCFTGLWHVFLKL